MPTWNCWPEVFVNTVIYLPFEECHARACEEIEKKKVTLFLEEVFVCCVFKEVEELLVTITQEHLKNHEQLIKDEYSELWN